MRFAIDHLAPNLAESLGLVDTRGSQGLPCARDARAHGVDRDSEDFGRLLVSEAFDDDQQQDLAMFFLQTQKGVADLAEDDPLLLSFGNAGRLTIQMDVLPDDALRDVLGRCSSCAR